jgi:transposase-like protein
MSDPTNPTGSEGWIAGGLALLGAAAGAWKWWQGNRRNTSRDDLEIAKDRAEVDVLTEQRAERKELREQLDRIEEELAIERKERLSIERLHIQAEGDLRAARRDLLMLQRKLDKAGVSRSDWAPFLETTFDDDAAPPAR